jgi:hypothetical protein
MLINLRQAYTLTNHEIPSTNERRGWQGDNTGVRRSWRGGYIWCGEASNKGIEARRSRHRSTIEKGAEMESKERACGFGCVVTLVIVDLTSHWYDSPSCADYPLTSSSQPPQACWSVQSFFPICRRSLTTSLPFPTLSRMLSRSLSIFNFVIVHLLGWMPIGTL